MIKQISVDWLKEQEVNDNFMSWFLAQNETGSIALLNKLVEQNRLEWANWLLVRVMKRKQYLLYSVYAVEQVADIYKKAFPSDESIRIAITSVKKCIEKDTEENRTAAGACAAAWAADWAAAWAAAWAARAAAGAARAAWAAAFAAWAASGAAAWSVARGVGAAAAAWAAAFAAWAAAMAAGEAAGEVAAYSAEKETLLKILKYGLLLLDENIET